RDPLRRPLRAPARLERRARHGDLHLRVPPRALGRGGGVGLTPVGGRPVERSQESDMRRTRWAPTVLVAVTLSGAVGTASSAQTTHRLPLTPENIHWGYYDATLEPVLRIRSGDRVAFDNMLARGLERLRMAGFEEGRFLPS